MTEILLHMWASIGHRRCTTKLAEERGFGAEEIAAGFGVTAQVARQRLRLGAVSPKLMQLYRDRELTMDQVMAFALTEDHARHFTSSTAATAHQSPTTTADLDPFDCRRSRTRGDRFAVLVARQQANRRQTLGRRA